jgi:16S rRNA C1402 (ribose-2'-O) methylase RsmI
MNMANKKTKAHWEKFCAEWNTKNPVGTSVTLKRDNGQTFETKTRSAAYVSDAGYPVIFLEGVSGYYLLDRVAPVT